MIDTLRQLRQVEKPIYGSKEWKSIVKVNFFSRIFFFNML